MALRPCAPSDWLRLDALHAARMAHKRRALRTHGWQPVGGAMACRPEAAGAVGELLAMLAAYLPARFPGLWAREGEGERWLRNKATGEAFEVVAPWGGFFKKVTADRLVMRVNWGINEREELFFLDGTHLYEGDEASADPNIDIDQVQLRVERQVLRRLPKSGAICMLTKTYLYRLVDITKEPGVAARLGGMLHKLPEKFAFYKRKPVWGNVVLAYLDEMAVKHPALATDGE
ncbi:hypothetical protein SLS58_003440 [Diplodia intermedia]|uniref:Uncharacterized protein n=1 Tax=Diplodia intermedia TaxID=856260 RepID=A0ABR3TWR6_9PEZI